MKEPSHRAMTQRRKPFFTGRRRRREDQEHQLHRWYGPSNYSFLPTCSIEPAPGSKRPTISNYSAPCIILQQYSNTHRKHLKKRQWNQQKPREKVRTLLTPTQATIKEPSEGKEAKDPKQEREGASSSESKDTLTQNMIPTPTSCKALPEKRGRRVSVRVNEIRVLTLYF